MIVYRVYYAAEHTNREFNRDTCVVVKAKNRLHALYQAFDLRPQAVKWGMVEQSHTDRTPPVAPTTCHVSFWQSGDRAGQHAGQAYPVIEMGDEWVKYQLTPTMVHTVKRSRVKLVA